MASSRPPPPPRGGVEPPGDRRVVETGTGHLLVKAGQLPGASGIGGSRTTVTLDRPQPGVLEVRSLLGRKQVHLGDEAMLIAPDGGQLKVQLLDSGDTLLWAFRGDYTVYPHPRTKVALDVPAGNGLMLVSRPHLGAMIARAPAANSSPIQLMITERSLLCFIRTRASRSSRDAVRTRSPGPASGFRRRPGPLCPSFAAAAARTPGGRTGELVVRQVWRRPL